MSEKQDNRRGNDLGVAGEPDAIEALEADEQELALDILNELHDAPGDNVYRLRVSRVTGPNIRGSHEPFLFEIDATAVSGMQDRLSKEYGNGTYRVRVMRNNRIIRRYDIVIEVPRISSNPEPTKIQQQTEVNGIAQLLNDMNQRQMVFMEQIMQRMQTPPPQVQADPFAMMEKMSNIFANLRGNDSGASALLGAFTQGMEIVGKMNGEKGETGIMDIAKELINSPVVAKLMDAKNPQTIQRPINATPVHRPLPIGPQNPPKPPTSMLGNTESPEFNPTYVPVDNPAIVPGATDLETLLPLLLQKAERNADPGLYAEFLLDTLPDDYIHLILTDAQFLERLIAAYPAVGNHRPWFEETLAQMKAQAQTDGEPAIGQSNATQGPAFGNIVDTRGGSGNAGNPKANAGNRSGVQEKPGNS